MSSHVESNDEWAMVVRSARRGRPAHDLRKDGPACVIAIIGQEQGRWSAELTHGSAACRNFLERVSLAAGQERGGGGGVGSRLVGFALMQSWRCVVDRASDCTTFSMMEASRSLFCKRAGQRYMEHPILETCILRTYAGQDYLLRPGFALGQADWAGGMLRDAFLASDQSAFHVVRAPTGRQSTVSTVKEVLLQWQSRISSAKVFAWPVAHVVAAALVSGDWFGDVSVKWRRSDPLDVPPPPVQPPPALLRLFLNNSEVEHLRSAGPLSLLDSRLTPKGVKPFDLETVVSTLRSARLNASLHSTKEQLLAGLRFWYPHDWEDRLARLSPIRRIASRYTLSRCVVRLDAAMMLERREWYADQVAEAAAPASRPERYLAFDASPQHGIELFATVERLVRVDEPSGSVEQRSMPLVALGQGRAGVADKLVALVHQTWLEYGPTVSRVQAANARVRSCLTDMGTELAIADSRDVVAQVLGEEAGQRAPQAVDDEVSFMFPRALQIPGVQHIIDGALRAGLEGLSWWPAWSAEAKTIAQWVNNRGHRTALQGFLRRGGQPEHLIEDLASATDAFKQWRWKTLANVLMGLMGKESSIKAACGQVRAVSELAARDSSKAQAFLDAARSELFWKRVACLTPGVLLLYEFSMWVRGCPCHEAERKAGKAVQCQWAGCRAPELAERVKTVLAELSDEGQHRADTAWEAELRLAWLRSYSFLEWKLQWVAQDPYRIWQVEFRDKYVVVGGV